MDGDQMEMPVLALMPPAEAQRLFEQVAVMREGIRLYRHERRMAAEGTNEQFTTACHDLGKWEKANRSLLESLL